MKRYHLLIPITVLLALIIACGTAAPDPADSPSPEQSAAAPTAVPEAKAQPTEAPAMAMEPVGTLTVGLKEAGNFSGHPKFSVNPQLFVISGAPVVEALCWPSPGASPTTF